MLKLIYNFGDGESVELTADDAVEMSALVSIFVKMKKGDLL